MHGWILHNNTDIHELKRVAEEAAKANILLELINPKDIELLLDNANDGTIYVKGVKKELPEFAVAAFLNEMDYYNLAVLRQLNVLGVLCLNTAEVKLKTGDKLVTSQILAQHGIPVAKTALLRPGSDLKRTESEFGFPLIMKVLRGSKGKGVMLVRSVEELKNLVELYEAAGCQDEILIQEYIATTKGKDLRVFILGGKAIACFIRQNSGDGFKSNISGGGHGKACEMNAEIRELAEKVAGILGLNIGGIDLLFGPDGFIVGEANSLPGFQGLEAATGLNIAGITLRSLAAQLSARPAMPWRMKKILEETRTTSMPNLLLNLPKTVFPGVVKAMFALCPQVQEVVLMDMIKRCQKTEFGREHNFSSITSIEEFRKQVPVSNWSDYEVYAERMIDGEQDVIFPGKPDYFIKSSGTTSSKSKIIPESASGASAKKAVASIRFAFLLANSTTKMGHLLALSNAASVALTPTGIPIGTASGITRAQVDPALAKLDAYPAEIMDIPNNEAVDYLIMRFSLLHKDMMAVIGNNAGRLKVLADYAQQHAEELIADIEAGTINGRLDIPQDIRQLLEGKLSPAPERAAELRKIRAEEHGEFLLKHYWPQLIMGVFWLSSTIGSYVDEVRSILNPDTLYMDAGYGASEVKINIPLKPGYAYGPLAPFTAFFEFLPLDGGQPLLAHEVKDGETYELIVTTYSGLYRYNMGDLVKVYGFTGNTPNIEFISKSTEIATIGGEKIPGSVLNQYIREVAAKMGFAIRQCQLYPNPQLKKYELYIEPEVFQSDFPIEEYLANLEVTLTKNVGGYSLYRGRNLLNAPTLQIMKQGWQEYLYKQKLNPGMTIAQIKLPFIIKEQPLRTWYEE